MEQYTAFSQDIGYVKTLENEANTSIIPSQKIEAYNQLANYYAVFNLSKKADSVLQLALMVADETANRDVAIKLLINSSVSDFNMWSNDQTFERCKSIIEKGLRYAEETGKINLEVQAYIKLAGLYRRRNQLEKAMLFATKAFSAVGDGVISDTLKLDLFCELGNIHLAKADAVPAYKNFNTAYEIAYKRKMPVYRSKIYHCFAELYALFGDKDAAKNYLLESVRINQANKNVEGLFYDYIDLARFTDKKSYVEKAISIANELGNRRHILAAKKMMYYWYMVEGKNSASTLNYLYANDELLQYFKNASASGLIFEKAQIYNYSNEWDSAIVYYKAAEQDLVAANASHAVLGLYSEMADAYKKNGDLVKAQEYYKKTYDLAAANNNLAIYKNVTSELASLNAASKNYALAYHYAIKADSAKSRLQENAGKDKLALLQIEREDKKLLTDVAEAKRLLDRKHNLQIMSITMLIALFFGLMMFIGMFEVSKTFIKTTGYLVFISLFEFIILLVDHPIVAFTNGSPLKIWLIKIAFIAMLVPIQHFLEKRLINYLQSRSLLEARRHFKFNKFWKSGGEKMAGKPEQPLAADTNSSLNFSKTFREADPSHGPPRDDSGQFF